MKTRRIQTVVAFVVLLTLTIGGFWPATALESSQNQADPYAEFIAGQVLVKFKAGASASSVQATLDQYGAAYVETVYGSDLMVWRVEEGTERAVADQLSADAAVAYAEPNYIYYAFEPGPNVPNLTPNDPDFSKQWGHDRIHSEAGWDITTGSAGATIAIIDTGIDPGHPDLASKIVAGYDFIAGDADPTDTNGHGTHVSGIAAAVTNNSTGVAGVDWMARIMPIRVLGTNGSGPTSAIVAGINWATANGANVLNMSLGGSSYSQAMQDAVNAAHGAGKLVVAAMGNCRTTGPSCPVANPTAYPAAYDNVMAVAATGPSNTYSSFSQYGSHCDIAAPGGDMSYYHDPDGIYSTLPTYPVYLTTNYSYYQNYDQLNGTSQASPHVAGLAALVWTINPGMTPDQVQQTIESTAQDLGPAGWDQDYGHGLIDVGAALQSGAVPDAPVLAPITNNGSGTYAVDWSDVTGATSYSLQEADNAAFSSPTTAYSGTNSEYAVAGKAAGTTWYYRANASNANGAGPWSNVRSATVKPAAPILNPISNAGNADEYTVSWSASTGATGYTLQEDDNASFTSPTTSYMGPGMQYDVTGQPGGSWYYRVSASNAGGDSAWSAPVSTTVDPPALTPPALTIDNPSNQSSYDVTWTAVPTASAVYSLEQSADPYFANPSIVYTGTMTEHQVIGQSAGTWHYRVRGAGQYGRSPWSLPKSTKVSAIVFLPVVHKGHLTTSPITGPKPGYWREKPSYYSEFWVTADRANVDDFGIFITVNGCGDYKITHLSPEPISNDTFSWTGPFHASGTFSSETEVSGTYGLSSFPIAGCGNVSGGPWPYTSEWYADAKPLSATVDGHVPVHTLDAGAHNAFRAADSDQ